MPIHSPVPESSVLIPRRPVKDRAWDAARPMQKRAPRGCMNDQGSRCNGNQHTIAAAGSGCDILKTIGRTTRSQDPTPHTHS